jgi:hypothetical protein
MIKRETKKPEKDRAETQLELIPATQGPLLTRTHRAFGTFPSALLLWGYGDKRVEKKRSFEDVVVGADGRKLVRRLEMSTDSDLGLPRGSDNLILGALLHMLFDQGGDTDRLTLRKKELLAILGWKNNTLIRREIMGAIQRYYKTEFIAVHGWSDKPGAIGENRRLITGFQFRDDRKSRYKDLEEGIESGSEDIYFTTITFNREFINDLRQAGMAIDLKLLRSIKSPLTRRLFEYINYIILETKETELEESIRILARQKLGLTCKQTAPSYYWQKIEPAFASLAERGILKGYEYRSATHTVWAKISDRYIPPQALALPPLPTTEGDKEKLKKRLLRLGTYPNLVDTLVDDIPPKDLITAAQAISYIEDQRNNGSNRKGQKKGQDYNWGGWVTTELRYLAEHGKLRESLTKAMKAPTIEFGNATATHQSTFVEHTDSRGAESSIEMMCDLVNRGGYSIANLTEQFSSGFAPSTWHKIVSEVKQRTM